MNSRVIAIAGLAALVMAAGVSLYLLSARPEPERPATVEAPVTPAPEPPSPPERAPNAGPSPSRPRPAEESPTAAPGTTPEPVAAEAEPLTATLMIDSDVPGAEVFLDRTFLGVTPLTIPDVAPGPHRLNVTAAGYEGLSDTIHVVPGRRDITVEFKAIRLDATTRVVHKHAFGSCEGTLSATPGGLRYDSGNKDDAFTAPLGDLDDFTVDYLEQKMTVKLRNGRTYNFTDPEGNADRLFVFHRDVDKVRVRLAKGQ